MTVADIPAEARGAVRARHRMQIDELDYRRELRRLKVAGYSQREIATWLGIAQPSVLSAMRAALAADLDAPVAVSAVDSWVERALGGESDPRAGDLSSSAPAKISAAVDALLGVAL